MTRRAKHRLVFATIAIAGVVGGAVAFTPFWSVPENVKDARRFLAAYHATDRSGMTPSGSPNLTEVTNLEIPVAVDLETARLVRELPASHGWTVRAGKFNSSSDTSRAMSFAPPTPLDRLLTAVPILNRFAHPSGTFITITLFARKDIEQENFEKERAKRARGEMWTSVEAETSGVALGRDARIMPKHGHYCMSFPPCLRREYAKRAKTTPRP